MQPIQQIARVLWVRCRADNHRRTTKLLQGFGLLLTAASDVVHGAEILSELLLGPAGAERYDSITHLVGILKSQMAEPTKSLNSDSFASIDFHLAHGIEDRDTCAEEGSGLSRVDFGWDFDDRFGPEDAVFLVYQAGSIYRQ